MAIFAKYEGIDGESVDSGHEKWIDVELFGWGAERDETGATGSGRVRGAALLDDFTLVLDYEKAAPKLLEKCLRGEVVRKLEVELTRDLAEGRATYLRYELTNVTVASYQVDGSGEDQAPPTVVVGNRFEEIKVTYTEFGEDGNEQGTSETEYDVAKAEAKALKAAKKKSKKK